MTPVHYDYVILGSGFVESTMACVLSSKQKKVLLIDRNEVYGADLSSLQYTQLESYFGNKVFEQELVDLDREFAIDLTPKLLLADSDVVKLMVKYHVDESLEFVNIPGSFVYTDSLHNVPTNETQSLKTRLVGFWEKYSVMKFFWDVKKYGNDKLNYKFQNTMKEEFDKYKISKKVAEFIGHAIALNLDDSYLFRHPKETFDKICLYVRSIMSYENSLKSPYIYPKYGISGIIQGFIRSACIQGAEVMLRANIEDIDIEKKILTVIEPVKNMRLEITAGKIISDQSYLQMHSSSYEVIRGICILKGRSEIADKSPSSQILFLKSELKRENDIFVVILGKEEETAPEGYKIAIISTVKETSDPDKEIQPVVNKLGCVIKKFIEVRRIYKTADTSDLYFTKGVDESTNFESLFTELSEMCNKLGFDLTVDE